MYSIRLSNGKRVGNFSSPHSFTFEDGNVLSGVSDLDAVRLQVTFNEIELAHGDVKLSFTLSQEVKKQMQHWLTEYQAGNIDVVFCCLPMITALHAEGYDVLHSPFRSIRVTDRISKLISITKQCL